MGDTTTYAETVPNYKGGKPLTLEIGSRDGNVFIALSGEGVLPLRCELALDEARRIIRALEGATNAPGGADS